MSELFSRYISGTMFTEGTMTGSFDGVSGINPIVDRLNSISTADNLITGSMISGTNLKIYTYNINPSGSYPFTFEVYTGDGYDSIKTSDGTNEDSHELNNIGSIYTSGINYMRVIVTGRYFHGTDGADPDNVQVKIQSKEIGGTYSDSLPYKIIAGHGVMENYVTDNVKIYSTFEHYHALSTAEQVSGIQFKMWSKSTACSNREVSFTNEQTVVGY